MHLDYLGEVFLTITVEQGNRVAGAEAANHGEMVSLGTANLDQSRLQGTVDIKSFGHSCYNMRLLVSGHHLPLRRSMTGLFQG